MNLMDNVMNTLFGRKTPYVDIEPNRDDEPQRRYIELRFKEIEHRVERLEQQARVMKAGHR